MSNNVHAFPGQQLQAFDAFSPAEWEGQPIPGRDWIIDGLIAVGQVAMISGDGGLGKSLLVQQLMTASALGKDWLGFPTKGVRSFGLFCEDDKRELHMRQSAINEHYGCTFGDLGEDMLIKVGVNMDNYLCSFDRYEDRLSPTPLWSQIEHATENMGAQMLILDTTRKTFGGKEVAEKQVARFVQMLRRWAVKHQGCVIMTAHPSNEGVQSGSGLAGSRAWNNDVRSRMYLTADKSENKPNARLLKVMKSNYAQSGGKVEIVWERGVFRRVDQPLIKDWTEPAGW